MKLMLVIFLASTGGVLTENLCKKSPRAPPFSCCPDNYLHSCCIGIKPCNKTNISPPRPQPTPRTSNQTLLYNQPFNNSQVKKFPCSPPWDTIACGAGFHAGPAGTVLVCPPGFFCPELQLCILPCPKGAYCQELEVVIPQQGASPTVLCNAMGMCCKDGDGKLIPPSRVQNNPPQYKCPGRSKPDACPKGYYCPNPVTKRICPRGHFCPAGSVEPLKCPLMTICKKGESAPLKNMAGPALAIFLLLLIIVAYQMYIHRADIKFYYSLYKDRIFRRQRSASTAFDLGAGLRSIAISTDKIDASSKNEIIPKQFVMDIGFKDLSLTLKARSKKIVLSGVTGCIKSGEVTAVMGPSGAGKTTFLNALSGKAYYGDLGGTITVNGMEVNSITKYRKETGFVPQEDTMHRKLTVKEVLLFQGRLRLPTSTGTDVIRTKVRQILELLEISHVQDVLIGDEETRGISGGQRKRVNIGMELIADPTLLFLDEPTSGLDSTSSLSVLRALRTVAEKGRLTVVCVIHQPRFEIFGMFHKLLFLGPGGRTVYQGTVDGAEKYFASLGNAVPPNVNPADFYMDVIGGVTHKGDEPFDPNVLFKSWEDYSNESHGDSSAPAISNGTSHEEDGYDNVHLGNSTTGTFEDRQMPNVFIQFYVFLKREVILLFRYIRSLMMDMFLVLLAGGILGALYSEVSIMDTVAMDTMSSLAIGLTAILASLRCFGNHRTTFWRESAAGVNRLSYFLAVNVCQLPLITLAPLVYLSLQYTFTSPRALFEYHYGAVFMAQFATTGIGYAISCIFNPRNSQMAAVVVVLISSLLSGSMPSLCSLDKFTFLGPLSYNLSYSRWFVEALFEKEAERYPDVLRTTIDVLAFRNNYDLKSYGLCLSILFVFGIVFRIFAFLFLVFTNRGQQK